ncbi:hypothetical protein O6H91_Y071800 [Diphasiastrum complanatum]|nr:hypothetical protein O6H91_Y071800 [Diphasiastrum complanatum]
MSSAAWMTGFSVDILGAVLMLRAVSLAPVSIVQPVSGCGLAILAIFSHYYLKEVMNMIDWLGVVMATAGTICVGVTGEEQKDTQIFPLRLLWFALSVAIVLGALDLLGRSKKGGRRTFESPGSLSTPSTNAEVMEEVVSGIEAGAFFGLAATICRMGFMLYERGYSKLFVAAGITVGICCSSSGFFCQTRGLKDGRAVVVSTCAAVASIVTGVLVGLLVLGESLPVSAIERATLLTGWGLIVLGIIVLLNSKRMKLSLPRYLQKVFTFPKTSHKAMGHTRRASYSQRELTPGKSATGSCATVIQLKSPSSKYKP